MRQRNPAHLGRAYARGGVRHETEVGDRYLRGGVRVTPCASARAGLVEQRWCRAERISSDSSGGGVERFVGAERVRGEADARSHPAIAAGVEAGSEQYGELGAARSEQHDIDRERYAARRLARGRRAIRHRSRISNTSL